MSTPGEFFQKKFIGLKLKEKTDNVPITPITDKAINNVKYIDIPGYTHEQCQYITEQHKELLRYARDNNENKEVSFIFRKGLANKIVIKGMTLL